jgi:hypothetical protein
MRNRLKAFEAKVAQEDRILTEAQVVALEKGQRDTEAHGKFESECPGLLRRAAHVLRIPD